MISIARINKLPLTFFLQMGAICWCVMVTLGEMVSFLPIAGGHISLAERFGNKALSFTMGWNYWYNSVIVCPVLVTYPARADLDIRYSRPN